MSSSHQDQPQQQSWSCPPERHQARDGRPPQTNPEPPSLLSAEEKEQLTGRQLYELYHLRRKAAQDGRPPQTNPERPNLLSAEEKEQLTGRQLYKLYHLRRKAAQDGRPPKTNPERPSLLSAEEKEQLTGRQLYKLYHLRRKAAQGAAGAAKRQTNASDGHLPAQRNLDEKQVAGWGQG